jgi:hypothetical protein
MWHLIGTELIQMIIWELRIQERVAPMIETSSEMNKRYLTGIIGF